MQTRKNSKAGPSSSTTKKKQIASAAVSTTSQATEEHLRDIQTGLQGLDQQIKALRKTNEKLQNELDAAEVLSSARDSNPGGKMAASDTDKKRIQKLEKKVKDLTIENNKLRRRIEKLKEKELREEVSNLQGSLGAGNSDDEIVDATSRMQKLLRRFSDLMVVTTIAADNSEECPVCWENLKIGECSALECSHIICHICLLKFSQGSDETVKCPECRKFTSREELELVHLTEETRWDDLTKVAQDWDAFDRRTEQESSEEEAEENFMTEGTEASVSSSEMDNDMQEATATDDDDASSKAATPPPVGGRTFSESPVKEKRKRMERLAEERAKKKRK